MTITSSSINQNQINMNQFKWLNQPALQHVMTAQLNMVGCMHVRHAFCLSQLHNRCTKQSPI
jgi:hypothetical protein